MTYYEREAVAQYRRTGELEWSAIAWLGEDGEDDKEEATARLRALLEA